MQTVAPLIRDFEHRHGPYNQASKQAFADFCITRADEYIQNPRQALASLDHNRHLAPRTAPRDLFEPAPDSKRRAESKEKNSREASAMFHYNNAIKDIIRHETPSSRFAKIKRETRRLDKLIIDAGYRKAGPGQRWHMGSGFFQNLPFEYFDNLLEEKGDEEGSDLTEDEVGCVKEYLSLAKKWPKATTQQRLDWRKVNPCGFVKRDRE
ncbi:hypothetical protein BD324DRAFT_640175 [Kockovaella imperatae]|uniref:Uncharacterized protein n=1 Tax=Kockovaella imperatae TaxID=4999 RepID=A0A1Y1U5L0_9TREE|nr:hypothetical protein BD324DRAFT_640175 [Kockovaella imperatae]ORX33319.1 hypothetical protein BD324DRAFT_640175 [Kockovaella imperatae]